MFFWYIELPIPSMKNPFFEPFVQPRNGRFETQGILADFAAFQGLTADLAFGSVAPDNLWSLGTLGEFHHGCFFCLFDFVLLLVDVFFFTFITISNMYGFYVCIYLFSYMYLDRYMYVWFFVFSNNDIFQRDLPHR